MFVFFVLSYSKFYKFYRVYTCVAHICARKMRRKGTKNIAYIQKNAKKNAKNLRISKKSSTFAPAFEKSKAYMVVLAQLVEHRIVVPSVKGSSPLFHPRTFFGMSFFCIVACTLRYSLSVSPYVSVSKLPIRPFYTLIS